MPASGTHLSNIELQFFPHTGNLGNSASATFGVKLEVFVCVCVCVEVGLAGREGFTPVGVVIVIVRKSRPDSASGELRLAQGEGGGKL